MELKSKIQDESIVDIKDYDVKIESDEPVIPIKAKKKKKGKKKK